jgi:hypothetical protein
MNSLSELDKVTDKSLASIEDAIKKTDKDIFELIDPLEVDERSDKFYNLPQYVYPEDSHASTNNIPYNIVSVELTESGLQFNGVNTFDQTRTFNSTNFSHTLICELANLIDVINSSK